MDTSFQATAKSKVRRKPDRASYDRETIYRILDSGVICHVGYVIDGEPFVTPTAYWREGNRLFWHGAAASRMLRSQANGAPVCVTVSHLDGLVLGRSGLSHSILYRSVMAFGHTSLVNGLQAKRRAMDGFIDRLYAGRTQEIRPIHAKELDAIIVMSMTIDEVSAKIRAGGVVEKDEQDYESPAWAGVISIRSAIGEIIPDAHLGSKASTPPSLADYARHDRLDKVLLLQTRRHDAPAVRERSFPNMTRLLQTAKLWYSRAKQRRHLADLDDRLLRDIGVTRAEAEEEAGKWFWRP